jgi:opacity protein-like surface antigen
MHVWQNRMSWFVGVCLVLVIRPLPGVAGDGPAPTAADGIRIPVPLAEGEADGGEPLPHFDWRDEDYVCSPSGLEPCQAEPRPACRCRQGTDGCSCRCPRCVHGPRFYLAGVVGASFATLTTTGYPSATDPLFTSGGIAGLAFEMLDTDWRVEVEGRARNPISETLTFRDDVTTSALAATGGWSSTVNLWRDFGLTDALAAYVGAGVGGGGYRFRVNQQFPADDVTVAGTGTVGGFAWQAGCGMAYAINDWITLDLGYRFFEIAPGAITADVTQSGLPLGTRSIDSGFSASEVCLAIRIVEPFRAWR